MDVLSARDLGLDLDEIGLLLTGVQEWDSSTPVTGNIAHTLDYSSVEAMRAALSRLQEVMKSGEALSRTDWIAAEQATELIATIDAGPSTDWNSTSGLSLAETKSLLKTAHAKINRAFV